VNQVNRREFLIAGTGAVALSAAIFRSVQGWLGEAAQYAGFGVRRPLSGSLAPSDSPTIDPVAHALNRMTFGAAPGDYARVSASGIERYLEQQLSPEEIDDGLCDRAIARLAEPWHEQPGENYEEDEANLAAALRRVTILRAVYSDRQLYEVMCEFWSDHFNIDPSKGDCRYTKIADDGEVIRKHALGNFSELLKASALSPAMLWYLDGRANVKRSATEQPNENYARELMELHTLGVHGGYTQQDVMEVARCLTGWTVYARKNDGFSGKLDSPIKLRGEAIFRPEAHDDGTKVVLGQTIPAGLRGGDLDRVISIVASHPSTARHIATKLCERFISDQPPVTAVDAVAAAFVSTKGEIKACLRALFATPEFQEARGAKLKRPFHYVVSALRATNAETDGAQPLMSFLEKMGQVPFRWPTPDGYPMEGAHWHATLLWRWKFALALANDRINGTSIQRFRLQRALGSDRALMASLLNRQASETEQDAFFESGDGLALLLASPSFQRC
jgi:uncharacterized protein (DUF1800 family)